MKTIEKYDPKTVGVDGDRGIQKDKKKNPKGKNPSLRQPREVDPCSAQATQFNLTDTRQSKQKVMFMDKAENQMGGFFIPVG